MKVLIIEDDHIFGDMVSLYLSAENFTVQIATTGQEGLSNLLNFAPDAVLLDLNLPDMNGIELCKAILSQCSTSIIIVSMNSQVSEKIKALTAGADDYLAKPFSMQELKARIIASVRKGQATSPAPHHNVNSVMTTPQLNNVVPPLVEHHPYIRLDLERRAIYVNQELIETTFSEFEILKLFITYPEKVFSRDALINAVRGLDSFVNDRSVDVHVTNLRKKIEIDSKQPKFIKTVWGIGYSFSFVHSGE